MTYNVNVSGARDDAIAQLRERAAAQAGAMQGAEEKESIGKGVEDATKLIEQFAGEGDSVSVSISGHVSRSDTSFAYAKSCSVSISKANAASTPSRDAAVTGLTAEQQSAQALAGAAPAGQPAPVGALDTARSNAFAPNASAATATDAAGATANVPRPGR